MTVEKIYQIMHSHGLGNKKVWATEFGWLARPPDAIGLPRTVPIEVHVVKEVFEVYMPVVRRP